MSIRLEKDFDGLSMARPQNIFFPVFRSYPAIVKWGIERRNIIFFHDDDINQLEFFLDRTRGFFRNPSMKLRMFSQVVFSEVAVDDMDWTKEMKKYLPPGAPRTAIPEPTRFMLEKYREQVEQEKDVRYVLETLCAFRDEVRSEARRQRVIELTGRKMSVVLWSLTDDMCREISSSVELTNMLVSLLEDSYRERIYLVLTARSPHILPVRVVSSAGLTGFVGEENSDYARKLYSNAMERAYDPELKVIGIIWDGSVIWQMYSFDKEPSEWFKKQVEDDKIINEKFERFLSTLDDGQLSPEELEAIRSSTPNRGARRALNY